MDKAKLEVAYRLCWEIAETDSAVYVDVLPEYDSQGTLFTVIELYGWDLKYKTPPMPIDECVAVLKLRRESCEQN